MAQQMKETSKLMLDTRQQEFEQEEESKRKKATEVKEVRPPPNFYATFLSTHSNARPPTCRTCRRERLPLGLQRRSCWLRGRSARRT